MYLVSDVPVGPHLADQLLLPLAVGAGGSFVTITPTLHTKTNIDVIQRFLNVDISTTEIAAGRYRVSVAP